jgi:hypothetical protein
MRAVAVEAAIALATLGAGGPLTRACFDDRHFDCPLLTGTAGVCNCACHRHPDAADTQPQDDVPAQPTTSEE